MLCVRFPPWCLPAVAGALIAVPLSAQAAPDSGAYIVRLGADTLAMERYVRQGDRIEAWSVTRSPRTQVRRLSLTVAPDGSVARLGAGPPDRIPEERAPAVAGTVPLAGGFWTPWALVLRRAQAAGSEVVEIPVLVGGTVRPTSVRRTGSTRFELPNQFDQRMSAELDDRGRLLWVDVGGGNTVERVAWFDLDRWANDFAARDSAGRGLGPLSPRETAEAGVRGARIRVEYGRPSLRGRDLRLLVPYGEVWRAGANDASTLSSDRSLVFEGLSLEPGTYSLFVLPEAGRWTLIVNRQTGMSGLDRDPAQDLGRVAMAIQEDAAPTERLTIEVRQEGQGGALILKWGRTEAVARFRVGSPGTRR